VNCTIVYHYFPKFRREIFDALRQVDNVDYRFIYGRNARFGIQNVIDQRDSIRKNLYIGTFVIQSIGFRDLWQISHSNNLILGDIKFLNSWLYAIICRIYGKKVYFWTHGILQSESWLKTRIRRFYYALAHGLFLYSDNEQELLRKEGYRTAITVIGNSNFSDSECDSDFVFPQSEGCFYVGRVTTEKRLTEFVDFASENPLRSFVIVGDGDAKDELLQYHDEHHCENLRILPSIYDMKLLSQELLRFRNLVFFSPIGLSSFTAALLGKRIFVRAGLTHKPEYHLLRKYGLVQEFSSFEQLRQLLDTEIDEVRFRDMRARFLRENSATAVARKISQVVAG